MHKVLYPGSFDPVTAGHMDMIARAAAVFDQVIVGVLHNPQKLSGTFAVPERMAILEEAIAGAGLANVRVQAFTGLLVDAVRECGADGVVRGLRSAADVEIELQMARLNLQLGGVETCMLAASPGVVHISASMVREIGRLRGDLRGFVPEAVRKRIEDGLRGR